MTPSAPSAAGLGPLAAPDRVAALALRGLPAALTLAGRVALHERVNAMPVMRHLAARLDLTDAVATRVVLDRVQPFHLGGLERPALNGGVIAAMLDGAMVAAGMAQFPGRHCGTVDLAIKLLRPVFTGRAEAVGIVLRRTLNLAFVAAELYDDGDRLCATASGIIAAPGRSSEEGGSP